MVTFLHFSKDEVFTEALKALYGTVHKQDITYNTSESEKKEEKPSIQLPSFREFIHYVYNESNARLQKTSSCFIQGNHVLPFLPQVYKEVRLESVII